jgi:hypothetical protein
MRIKKFLELEEEAKELQQRAKGRYVKTDDNGIIKIDLVIGIWLDRTKEATEILSKIAEANGIDLKQIQVEPINLIINNLDEDKI